MKRLVYFAFAACVLSAGCASTPSVTRLEPGAIRDVSGYWNDTDLRIVCRSLIEDFETSPALNRALEKSRGKAAKVIVGQFYNDSSEHIDTSIICDTMEDAIFNSGRLGVVAGGRRREELRNERLDQQRGFTRDSTAKSLSNETGADYVLSGSVKTIVDAADNRSVRTYYVRAQIIDLETNELVWSKQNANIKKEIVRPRVKL